MVDTKLLYVFVVILIVAAVYFLLTVGGNQAANALTNEGIDQFSEKIECTVRTFDSRCTGKTTDESGANCIWDEGGNPVYECTLCESEFQSSNIYKCELAVCGCGLGWSPVFGTITATLDKSSYKVGETMVLSGRLTTPAIEDRTGFEITVAVLDENKRPSTYFTGLEVAKAKDRDGNYEWSYKIPDGTKVGRYLISVDYKNARDLDDFSVTE